MGWAGIVKGAMNAANENLQGAMRAMNDINNGKIEKVNYETQARIAEIGAGVADWNAGNLMEQAGVAQKGGEIEAGRRSKAAGLDVGSARATAAGRGLLVDSGTAQSVTDNIRTEANEDIAIMNENTRMAVWGYTSQAGEAHAEAVMLRGQANVARINAKNAKKLAKYRAVYHIAEGIHNGGMAFVNGMMGGGGTQGTAMPTTGTAAANINATRGVIANPGGGLAAC